MCSPYPLPVPGREGRKVWSPRSQEGGRAQGRDAAVLSSDTHRRVAGLASEDASGLLFGHVEVFQVGVVDVLGEGLQVSHLRVVLTPLAGRQPCHQLPLLGLWHPAKADGCGG